MSAVRESALETALRGCIRTMGRAICAADVCDEKHPRWEDCVMFRRAVEIANRAVEMPR